MTIALDVEAPHLLKSKRLSLYTQDEVIVLMRTDCPVCISEGLTSRSRVRLTSVSGREIIATLYQVENDWLTTREAGLSEAAWTKLGVEDGTDISVSHAPTVGSLADIRRRIYGGRLDEPAFQGIIGDITAGRYADIHLATFIATCSALPLDIKEICHLTKAMIDAGERLSWETPMILDKHCVGGLPGNRTTPIVVAIVASLGFTMPKTSSRAITSPAGTADTMETLAPVDLDLKQMRRVVEEQGACIVWGGAVRLSPADDILIRIERALDIDTEGQLIASVLSKKIAAGATHVVIDLPVGPTAKVRSLDKAKSLSKHISAVATQFGLETRSIFTDGSQPVGRGIGPALEAYDVLAVLQNKPNAPQDLKKRAISIAAQALEMAGHVEEGAGQAASEATLLNGRAWEKFQAICEAQGGMRTPPIAPFTRSLLAQSSGKLAAIDNRKLSRLAKLAGAPNQKAAGLVMHIRLGDSVKATEPLLTVHAEAKGALDYAIEYAAANPDILTIEE
ncbi:thymidine phosphorylase family protein [Parasphingorhabdus sp.]|uniref:thymidine phosphorylase family protein n=1 Tax=Parasphingorhabdus sp. TaxID=2709688 RepID=UPI002F9432C9